MFLLVSVLLLINGFVPLAAQTVGVYGFVGAAARLFGVGLVYYCAGFAMVEIGRSRDAQQTPANRVDVGVAAICVALALMPLHWLAKGALVPLSAYLIASSRRESPEWRIGIVLSAIAAALVLGALLLTAFATPLLNLDGALVRLITGASGAGNIIDTVARPGSGSIERVVVLADCSSVRNISQATILWASMTQLFAVPITARMVRAGGFAMLAIVAINTARIAAYVYLPQYYAVLHAETFASIFGLASLLSALAIIAWAILRESSSRPA